MKQLLSLIGLCIIAPLALSAATLGEWSYSRRAAEELADTWDRPLIIKFSNSSGACSLCNLFEKQINSCDYWKAYASEQQLALHFIDYDRNWDMECYLALVSENPRVKAFPAFAIYASDGFLVHGNPERVTK